MHPSRIQLFDNNLEADRKIVGYKEHVKFNSIGMPFNFKKLVKRANFSGHINYSSPELVLENDKFNFQVDTWSFGCCVAYLFSKKDPFEGRTSQETK